jgi:hypothetical protein
MFTKEQQDFVFCLRPQMGRIQEWFKQYNKNQINAGPFILPTGVGKAKYDSNGRIIAVKVGFFLGGEDKQPRNLEYRTVISEGYLKSSPQGIEWVANNDQFQIADLESGISFLVDCYNRCAEYLRQGIS